MRLGKARRAQGRRRAREREKVVGGWLGVVHTVGALLAVPSSNLSVSVCGVCVCDDERLPVKGGRARANQSGLLAHRERESAKVPRSAQAPTI